MSYSIGKRFGNQVLRKGDVVATYSKSRSSSVPASVLKRMKRLSPIALLNLAQKRNASGKEINRLKHSFSRGTLTVNGINDYNTKYLYEEGNNIMNHMKFGNKKKRTVSQEEIKFRQIPLG